MEIAEALKNEIKMEQKLLDSFLEKRSADPNKYSLWCRTNRGRKSFYLRKKGEKKAKYAGLSQINILEDIYQYKYEEIAAKVIEENIIHMNTALDRIRPWDMDSIAVCMPKAFKELQSVLYKRNDVQEDDLKDVHQSENPKNRDGLVFKARNGVYVRSKNEMLILDALSMTDLEIWYEKRLDLVAGGSGGYNTESVYPDFTIKLPDGSIIYWEHMGLMDQEKYQKDNSNKLKLYFENGIYPPKNLIITVDGDTMPFDSSAVWRIIDGILLYGSH